MIVLWLEGVVPSQWDLVQFPEGEQKGYAIAPTLLGSAFPALQTLTWPWILQISTDIWTMSIGHHMISGCHPKLADLVQPLTFKKWVRLFFFFSLFVASSSFWPQIVDWCGRLFKESLEDSSETNF